MKKEKLIKIVSGALIPTIMLPSCVSNYYCNDDIVTINKRMGTRAFNSLAVPMDFNLNSYEQKVMSFIIKIVTDIIDNPLIAKQFAEDPNAVAKAYGIEDVEINFDDEIWKLITALGDSELHEAIKTNNVPLFLELCDSKGLLLELQKSELLKYQNIATTEAEIRPMCAGVVFFGVAAVLIAAAAGCIAVGAAAVAVHETNIFWDGAEKFKTMAKRDPHAYQLWAIKQGHENTYIMLSEYQDKLVGDCIAALHEYFPEKMVDVDMEKLRQFIALNLPK